jgi:CBS domain-containing protein
MVSISSLAACRVRERATAARVRVARRTPNDCGTLAAQYVAGAQPEEAAMLVEDVMCPTVHSARVGETGADAAQKMWNHDVGFLPVLDEQGRAVAAITDRDLCMASFTQGRALADIAVGSAMSRVLVAARRSDPVAAAERLMQTHQVRRLPVIDTDGRPVGIVTISDIARASVRRDDVSTDEVAHTFCDIVRPTGMQPLAAE